ncbi:MAG TPA: mycothiol synthase, partial [Ilumatobacteraceae bacterium]|nr:mycothiol synthase [Ilumatobacteraceae bacterium]
VSLGRMVQVQTVTSVDRDLLAPFIDQLDDHLRLDLEHGPRDGFVAAIASDGDRVVGYAQASRGNDGFVVDRVGEPRDMLLRSVLHQLPGEELVTWWTDRNDDASLAGALGLRPGRSLLQMTVPLPLEVTTDVVTRPFVVGRDEAAWLEVNNAAFDWHAEQGGWDLATLEQREREPWFDPDGFLLHERDERLAAFCWTKQHDGDVGEIYVIAVHPDYHGLGLGRALTVAGLQHLAADGATTGMLYVDADNESAVGLYRALGFSVVRTNRAFTRGTQ